MSSPGNTKGERFTLYVESDTAVNRADVLVIGGGGAGLMAAITAREKGADVLLVSKSRVGYGNNTYISKSGIAVVTGRPDLLDGPDTHFRDSVASGCFINDQGILERIVSEIGPQIGFLESCGVQFFKTDRSLAILKTGGHSRPRNIRSRAQTGSGFTVPLRNHALEAGVRFMENVMITRLSAPGKRFSGAVGLTRGGDVLGFEAKSCILATGGYAQIYLKTNNTAGTTGDGLALAYELGLPLRDMEFVQFYPTALGDLGRPMFLYEGFLFSPGAVLKNAAGENIVEKHGLSDPVALTRDRLARAVFQEIQDGLGVNGGVIMDIRHVPPEKISRLRHMLPAGWTPDQTQFTVSPTTHFCMGGVVTDAWGETEVAGLFAAGETCGGAHGANRLAGNALAEAFVMGGVAGEKAAGIAEKVRSTESLQEELEEEKVRLRPRVSGRTGCLRDLRRTLKELMWAKAGIVRCGVGLEESLEEIERIRSAVSELRTADGKEMTSALELQNMLLVSEMVSRAALVRTESRGAHYRSDYPEEDNSHWLKRVVIRKVDSGMQAEPLPVAFPLFAP